MLLIDHQPPKTSRASRYSAFAIVILIHLLLLALLALQRAGVFPPMLRPIEVQLIPGGGGGEPAAAADSAAPRAALPSSLHAPENPQPHPEPLIAPPAPAPQELAPVLTPGTPDAAASQADHALSATGSGAQAGQGGGAGSGIGTGTGDGTGSGSGSGTGSGAVLVRGPAGATITQNVSPQALAALPGSWAVLRCRIRLSQRLENCRVLRQHPEGPEVRRAALTRAGEFRFRPPRTARGYRDRTSITIGISFPPPEPAAPAETR